MARFFLDTEFIERGADFPLVLLSIGIVAEDGRRVLHGEPHSGPLHGQ